MKIGVAEEKSEILNFLSRKIRSMKAPIQMEKAAAGAHYDLLLIAPQQTLHVPREGCIAHTLIVHEEDAAEAVAWVNAASIVTYGTQRSTLALSSFEDICMIAVQREIADQNGNIIEIGELQLEIPPSFGQSVCMVAGAVRLIEMQQNEIS